jgi:hypothetical protein
MTTYAQLIRPHVQQELDAAASAEARGQFSTAFMDEAARTAEQPPGLRSLGAFAALAAVAALLAGCMSAPKDLDVSLSKPTAAGAYQVTLLPPAQQAPINQMHGWKVQVATPQGVPVQGAKFKVGGGMPQHGHGLPTQPRVTRELAAGTYQIDGIKFSMTGWWEVKLAIEGPQGADEVTFNTVIANPQVRP